MMRDRLGSMLNSVSTHSYLQGGEQAVSAGACRDAPLELATAIRVQRQGSKTAAGRQASRLAQQAAERIARLAARSAPPRHGRPSPGAPAAGHELEQIRHLRA